jgi:hypothetical protein
MLSKLTPCSRSRHPIILRGWGLLREASWGFVVRYGDLYADYRIYFEYRAMLLVVSSANRLRYG